MEAASIGSFTILSGFPTTTENVYNGSNFISGGPPGNESEFDTVAPTFVSMLPRDGATDVDAAGVGNAVVMYFSEPVKFNASGLISFKNGTGYTLATVNLTAGNASEIDTRLNATKFLIPPVLEKGKSYIVSIPAGTVKDFAGNGAAALVKEFKCLEEKADTNASVVVAMAQDPMDADVIDVFFSEDIVKGSAGHVALVAQKSAVNITVPVTADDITINGSKLSFSLRRLQSGVLGNAGAYDVHISAGAVKDLAGNLFQGISGDALSLLVEDIDTTKPLLSTSSPRMPMFEEPGELTFGVPSTASMLLEFNENLQVSPSAPGVVGTLTPIFGHSSIDIPLSNVYIDETKVVLTGQILRPGEAYSITIRGDAFVDLAGNNYPGFWSGYTISTKPLVSFRKMPDRKSDMWAISGQSDGKRYGGCSFVDPTNTIYMIGGASGGPLAKPDSMLGDVWRYSSQRPTDCASTLAPFGCSETVCLDNTTLATVAVNRTVWRIPSVTGSPCRSSESGKIVSMLWETVDTTIQTCPCPLCIGGPPEPLPKDIMDVTYLNNYSLVSLFAPAVPLMCRKGMRSNSSFQCVFGTQYEGRYFTPYPQCYPEPCTSPPPTERVPYFLSFTTTGTTDEMNCSAINATYNMTSGGVCQIECMAGFTMEREFLCYEGEWRDAICTAITPCSQSDVDMTGGVVDCGQLASANFGETCPIKCDEGYSLTLPKESAYMTCGVRPGGIMEFFPPEGYDTQELCGLITCTAPFNEYGRFNTTGYGIWTTYTIECSPGSMIDPSGPIAARCLENGTLNGYISEPLPKCMLSPPCDGSTFNSNEVSDAIGPGDCNRIMQDDETCEVACAASFVFVGTISCSDGQIVGVGMCYPADTNFGLVQEVTMISSTLSLALDLSKVSQAVASKSVKKSLAAALQIAVSNVVSIAITRADRRLNRDDEPSPADKVKSLVNALLQLGTPKHERQLASRGYDVVYQAVVPDGVEAATLVAKAVEIGFPGATQSLFLNSFPDDIPVDESSIAVKVAPRSFTAQVLLDEDGKVRAPAPAAEEMGEAYVPPSSGSGPASHDRRRRTAFEDPSDDDSRASNMGSIIGGLIGGAVALLIICCGTVYFLMVRKEMKSG
eukprot:gnl/TRDRNA2_/TRDRNA2_170098_c1_seq3.p1 gnl/TRDRNA2_/TRDRNA2_170098_c1~~gnl/TRDRNA2_/TRDRNA2_170098_c1_seq3.p1  ORF type:complete len:1155 (-),score=157.59 gnl/TRDRNA2_/TRDRNA2_170098_c1_seq3:85-3441(-)